MARKRSSSRALERLRKAKKGEQGVREHERMGESFRALVDKYRTLQEEDRYDGLPLARLAIVGEAHAERLKEKGVASGDDLIRKAGTPAEREALARELDVSLDLLERWALTTDLMRVSGIDAGKANLLEWERAGSLEALRGSNAEGLARLLGQLNQAQQLAKQPPQVEETRRWIQDAGHLEPEVQIG